VAKLTHIVDWAARNIRIEGYQAIATCYARFTVYPTGMAVRTAVGEVTYKEVIEKLVSESVSINGRLTPASMFVKSIVSQNGILFDENDNLIEPTFGIENGMLSTGTDCTGTLVIEYLTDVALYEYNAKKTIIPTVGAKIEAGMVWAYDPNTPKNVVTYQIPLATLQSTEQRRFARVYREILVADKRYELPTTFTDNDITYTSYPTANTSELDTSTRKDELTQEELLWDGMTVQRRDRGAFDWCYPTADDVTGFLDVDWKLSVDIPDELTLNTVVSAALAELKTKYGLP